jgi:ABC-2 type transport system permease protein
LILKTSVPLVSVIGIVFLLGLIAFALTSLGFVLAWRMDSVQGFHAMMSVLLLPMWLLSGAFFPAGNDILGWIIRLNPLTYGISALRHLIYSSPSSAERVTGYLSSLPSPALSWGVTLAFGAIMFCLSVWVSNQRTTGDML